MITAIIPLRLATEPLYDEIERLDRICASVPPEDFNILIVDYGTDESRVPELRTLGTRYSNLKIVRTGDPEAPFSIGAARDFGVQAADTPVIMFHDLDFLCETETYRDIAAEAQLRLLDKRGYDYICVPTIYLTPAGTEFYVSKHNQDSKRNADRAIHSQVLRSNRTELVEHYSLGSSALLINRYFYLISGGHDRGFVGHGAEDFEFYNRLSDLAPRAGRPPNFSQDISFINGNWQGFRAYFALYGMDMWMRGVCLVHLHHPRREEVDVSYRKSANNFKLLQDKLADFVRKRTHLQPLTEPHVAAKTLVLVDSTSLPAQALRGALPALGQYSMMPEGAFDTPSLLLSYIEEEGYDHVLFLNPYGNPHRLSLFEAVRAARIKFFAFDRGALPDSWFFDDGGFLGNSTRYDPVHWDKPLSEAESAETRSWMRAYSAEGVTLEPNAPRKSAEHWRSEFGLGKRKMILVALQRPNDTATKFFAGPTETYQQYLGWIENLAKKIDRRKYVLVVKKHPLESERTHFDGAKLAPDDANIHDLIEASHCLVVLNSGTGVIALAMSKPVIACGHCYYAHEGLAYQANSEENLLELVRQDLKPAGEAAVRFLHYLRNEFYSFGVSRYFEKREANGAITKIANRIDFSIIRGLPGSPVELGEVPPWIAPGSFLMRGAVGFKPAPQAAAKPAQQAAAKPAQQAAAKPAQQAAAKPAPQPRIVAPPKDLRTDLQLANHAQRLNGNVIEIGKGKQGHGVYGPYLPLEAGCYRVDVCLEGESGGLFRAASKIVVDVAVNGGRDVLVSRQLSSADFKLGAGRLNLEFEIDFADPTPIEVRIWTDGRGVIRMTEATLVDLGMAQNRTVA